MTTTTTAERLYTADEVSRHNKVDDLWLALHGNVYDITKFLQEHPGGEEVLLNLAGQDGSQCFDDIGHTEEAKTLKETFKIGTLHGSFASPSSTERTTTTTTTTGAASKSASAVTEKPSLATDGGGLENDDDWQYEEQPKKESSSNALLFIGIGVLVYGVIFYYLF